MSLQDCFYNNKSNCNTMITLFVVAAAEFRAINDPKVEYIYDLSEGFCETAEIRQKYKPLVQGTCDKLMKVRMS
jgi:hypothetical protein